jgi:hypothetical protein
MLEISLNEPERLDEVIKQQLKATPHSRLYVLFYGTDKPETRESWCPDCARAKPIIFTALQPKDCTLIIAHADRTSWKDMQSLHAYRKHKLNIQRIPTLVALSKETGEEVARLVEGECESVSNVGKL